MLIDCFSIFYFIIFCMCSNKVDSYDTIIFTGRISKLNTYNNSIFISTHIKYHTLVPYRSR